MVVKQPPPAWFTHKLAPDAREIGSARIVTTSSEPIGLMRNEFIKSSSLSGAWLRGDHAEESVGEHSGVGWKRRTVSEEELVAVEKEAPETGEADCVARRAFEPAKKTAGLGIVGVDESVAHITYKEGSALWSKALRRKGDCPWLFERALGSVRRESTDQIALKVEHVDHAAPNERKRRVSHIQPLLDLLQSKGGHVRRSFGIGEVSDLVEVAVVHRDLVVGLSRADAAVNRVEDVATVMTARDRKRGIAGRIRRPGGIVDHDNRVVRIDLGTPGADGSVKRVEDQLCRRGPAAFGDNEIVGRIDDHPGWRSRDIAEARRRRNRHRGSRDRTATHVEGSGAATATAGDFFGTGVRHNELPVVHDQAPRIDQQGIDVGRRSALIRNQIGHPVLRECRSDPNANAEPYRRYRDSHTFPGAKTIFHHDSPDVPESGACPEGGIPKPHS